MKNLKKKLIKIKKLKKQIAMKKQIKKRKKQIKIDQV